MFIRNKATHKQNINKWNQTRSQLVNKSIFSAAEENKCENKSVFKETINMHYKQVGKTATDSASVEELSTAIADKTHLANLITSLKSELATTTALLKIKESEFNEAKEQLTRHKGELKESNKQVELLGIQCANYRQTVSHFHVEWLGLDLF